MPPSQCRTEEERQWIPQLERGCCCTLEFCCKVQAMLVVMGSLMYTPMVLVEYFRCQRPMRPNGPIIYGQPPDCRFDEGTSQARIGEVIIKILLQTITLLSALVFLVGIARRRPKLLLPYVRVLSVHMVFCFIALVVRTIVFGMWLEAIIFVLPIGVGIPYYMWLCAYSLYRKMKREVEEASMPPPVVDLTAPVRLYAPPPGFVIPEGFGYAPPVPASAAAVPGLSPVVSGSIPHSTTSVGPGVAVGFVKPEDIPPPSYNAVVGTKPEAPNQPSLV